MLAENYKTRANPLTTRLLLICGVIGSFLFTIVYLIEGATRPGYNAWHQAISLLSQSDYGWEQITNFIVCGLLIFAFAIGVRQALRPGKDTTWGTFLLAAVGLGLIVAGVFVTDPAQGYPPGTPDGAAVHTTLVGTIHFAIGAPAVFGLLPVTCIVLARRFGEATGWKGGAAYSVLSGVLMFAFFIGFIVAGIHDGPAGLMERLSIMTGMAWIVVFAILLLRKTSVSH